MVESEAEMVTSGCSTSKNIASVRQTFVIDSLSKLLVRESASNTKIMTNKLHCASVNSGSLLLGVLVVLEHFYALQRTLKTRKREGFSKNS